MVTKVKDPGKPPQISLELEIVGASLCSAPKPAIFEHLYLKPKECSSKLLRVRVSLWEGRRAPSSSSVFPTQRHEHSRDSRPGLGSASKYIYMCMCVFLFIYVFPLYIDIIYIKKIYVKEYIFYI